MSRRAAPPVNTPAPEAIAVVGTGNMGPGIAASFAAAGHEVRLVGRSRDRLELALRRVAEGLGIVGLDSAVGRRIMPTTDLASGVAGTTLVIEAVAEDPEVKRQLFRRIDESVEASTILASTTSALLLQEVAAGVSAPGRLVILHYFYPPLLIPVVEVVRGPSTSDETTDTVVRLLRRSGKRPVVLARQVRGFIGNRLLHALMSEAISLVREGVASAEDVDAVVRGAFTLRLVNAGPLESADLVGLDLIQAIHTELLPDLERLGTPDPYLNDLVDEGRLGAKSGRGFYDWSTRDADRRRQQIQEGVQRVLRAVAEPDVPA